MKLSVIYTPTRVDLYKDGDFASSTPRIPEMNIPAEQADSVEAYFPENLAEDFSAAIGQREFTPIQGPCLVETDEDLILLDENEAATFPLRTLWMETIAQQCESLDICQQEAGYFPMSESERTSTAEHLFSSFQEWTSRPKSVIVPIFAWFNYATLGEDAIDESDVITQMECAASALFEEAVKQTASHLSTIRIPKHRFIRSGILRETLESIPL